MFSLPTVELGYGDNRDNKELSGYGYFLTKHPGNGHGYFNIRYIKARIYLYRKDHDIDPREGSATLVDTEYYIKTDAVTPWIHSLYESSKKLNNENWVQVFSPASNSYENYCNKSPVNLNIIASDDYRTTDLFYTNDTGFQNSYKILTDTDSVTETFSANASFEFADGPVNNYTITMKSRDFVGHETDRSETMYIDTLGPLAPDPDAFRFELLGNAHENFTMYNDKDDPVKVIDGLRLVFQDVGDAPAEWNCGTAGYYYDYYNKSIMEDSALSLMDSDEISSVNLNSNGYSVKKNEFNDVECDIRPDNFAEYFVRDSEFTIGVLPYDLLNNLPKKETGDKTEDRWTTANFRMPPAVPVINSVDTSFSSPYKGGWTVSGTFYPMLYYPFDIKWGITRDELEYSDGEYSFEGLGIYYSIKGSDSPVTLYSFLPPNFDTKLILEENVSNGWYFDTDDFLHYQGEIIAADDLKQHAHKEYTFYPVVYHKYHAQAETVKEIGTVAVSEKTANLRAEFRIVVNAFDPANGDERYLGTIFEDGSVGVIEGETVTDITDRTFSINGGEELRFTMDPLCYPSSLDMIKIENNQWTDFEGDILKFDLKTINGTSVFSDVVEYGKNNGTGVFSSDYSEKVHFYIEMKEFHPDTGIQIAVTRTLSLEDNRGFFIRFNSEAPVGSFDVVSKTDRGRVLSPSNPTKDREVEVKLNSEDFTVDLPAEISRIYLWNMTPLQAVNQDYLDSFSSEEIKKSMPERSLALSYPEGGYSLDSGILYSITTLPSGDSFYNWVLREDASGLGDYRIVALCFETSDGLVGYTYRLIRYDDSPPLIVKFTGNPIIYDLNDAPGEDKITISWGSLEEEGGDLSSGI